MNIMMGGVVVMENGYGWEGKGWMNMAYHESDFYDP